MIRYRCPSCDGLLENSPAAAGMTLACRHCHTPVEVPGEGTNAGAARARPAAEKGPSAPSEPVIDRLGRMLGAHASDEIPAPMGAGPRILCGFLGLFLTAIFGGMFLWAILSFVTRQASLKWPSARGKVTSAGVSKKVGRTSRGNRTVEYSAVVAYTYTVGGKEYTSTQLGFGPTQNYSFLARALAEPYREGQSVTVYYDPANPKEAVLQREVLFGGYVVGFVGLFAGFIGLRLVLVSLALSRASANSRWLPWSRRFTWPDLPVTILGAFGLLLWLPMLFGV